MTTLVCLQAREGKELPIIRRRRYHRIPLVALLIVLGSVAPGYATCDSSTDPDKSDIANARAAVATNCDCAGALTHGAYVSCAAQQADEVIRMCRRRLSAYDQLAKGSRS